MENDVNKNSGWPGFFQSNSPLAWFVAIASALLVTYLVFKGATIEGCGVKVTPMAEKQQDGSENTKQESKNQNTQTADRVDSEKDAQIIKNEPVAPVKTSATETLSHDKIEFQSSVLQGYIVDKHGRSAVRAKVTCLNCIESNSPCISDESGSFQLKYKIGYKAFEYPVKKIELSISYNGAVFSASQSITQNSITVELK